VFARLCVDIDHRGNVRGCSVTRYDSDGPATIWTTSVGPFDNPHDALDEAQAWLMAHIGEQLDLF